MKTIQIAPHKEDCTITDTAIRGTMDGRTFVYELGPGETFNLDQADKFIESFRTAIGMLSKPWQITDVLNSYFGVPDGKFYEV